MCSDQEGQPATRHDDQVWEYVVSDEKLHSRITTSLHASLTSLSSFDLLLRQTWENAAAKGVLRYELPDLKTKIVPGPTQFVAQLNTRRASQRRRPGYMARLDQPFDQGQFNFTKIKSSEILFSFVDQLDGRSPENDKQHAVIVNASPLEYCNVLLIPTLRACLPQVLTAESLKLAVLFALSSMSRSFRVAFNSLCAFASVNHLHYHAYCLDQKLPCEDWMTSHVAGPCYELVNYPARGFVFYYEGSADMLARSIHKVSYYFHSHNIAHNMMITRGQVLHNGASGETSFGLRALLWPRKSSVGVKSSSAFNVAVCELAGHLPIYNEEDYYTMTDERACRIIGETTVTEDQFQTIRADVKDLFN